MYLEFVSRRGDHTMTQLNENVKLVISLGILMSYSFVVNML